MCSRPFRPVGLPIYVARLPRLHSLVATELVTTRAMPDRDVLYVAHPIRSIVSRLLPQRSTATSRLYRPCRSSRSLHSSETRLSARPAGRGDKARPCTSRTPLLGMGGVTPQIKVGYRCD